MGFGQETGFRNSKLYVYMYKGFTLTELIIVIVIIGIIIAFASPQFIATKERALDKEAKVVIALIQAAEKTYRMEQTFYYPYPAGTATDVTNINNYLRLSLPVVGASSIWNLSVNSIVPGQAVATRNKAGGRNWSMLFNSDLINCTANNDTCL